MCCCDCPRCRLVNLIRRIIAQTPGTPGPQGPQGEQGPAGEAGPQGVPGIQGPEGEQGLQGVQGEQGIQGENGLDGTGLQVLGSYEDYETFIAEHPTGNPGDAWFVDGSLYVWDANAGTWDNVGYLRGPQGIQGIQGVQGIQGEDGPVGAQGVQGQQGIQGPVGPQGPSGMVPTVYHRTLPSNPSSFQVAVGKIGWLMSYVDAASVSIRLRGVDPGILIDVKRSSQWGGTASEGQSLDNYNLTSTLVTIDSIIYNESNEMNRTWIRQQDPDTLKWSLHEVCVFVSNKGARVDVWVNQIYADASAW